MQQHNARILIIEDEEDVCLLLADILSQEGHAIATASDGRAGLALFQQQSFDIVFTDLAMPNMTGWQVAEEVKKIDTQVPVILITGWSMQTEEKEMYKSHVDMIVTKPFTVDEIVAVLTRALALRQTQGTG